MKLSDHIKAIEEYFNQPTEIIVKDWINLLDDKIDNAVSSIDINLKEVYLNSSYAEERDSNKGEDDYAIMNFINWYNQYGVENPKEQLSKGQVDITKAQAILKKLYDAASTAVGYVAAANYQHREDEARDQLKNVYDKLYNELKADSELQK